MNEWYHPYLKYIWYLNNVTQVCVFSKLGLPLPAGNKFCKNHILFFFVPDSFTTIFRTKNNSCWFIQLSWKVFRMRQYCWHRSRQLKVLRQIYPILTLVSFKGFFNFHWCFSWGFLLRQLCKHLEITCYKISTLQFYLVSLNNN